jgi:hypothetical protein
MSNTKEAASTKEETLQDIGRGAAAAIVEMVAALEVDYDRLEDLQAERDEWLAEGSVIRKWENESEYDELREAAGECKDREEAETRIQEDALSVEMRGAWYTYDTEPSDVAKPVEFKILLATGGPAVQIRGELDDHGEPYRAWLEVQDWGTPWTRYFDISQDTLLAYARCFYFGEG